MKEGKVMGSRSRAASLAACVAATASLGLAAPAFGGTLDQQQPVAETQHPFGNSFGDRAQTFTAGLSGALDQVDLMLECPTSGTATVDITTVASGAPTETVLASEDVGLDDDAEDATFDAVAFSAPATVTSGTQYAIAVSANCNSAVLAANGDEYAGGAAFSRPAPCCGPLDPWDPHSPSNDLAFRTYVVPAESNQICKGEEATQTGTDGPDVLVGTDGPDVIVALDGKDKLKGFDGDDKLCGGGGKDKLKGGGGKDLLRGEQGADKLNGGGGKDKCVGGKGDDTAKKCEVERSI
jgi:Ca2+-binding RTX toxin-like protein